MELVEETARWQEEEMENEWESLALGPGWAPLLRAPGQEEGKATGLPAGGQSCQWGVVQGSSLPGTHRSHRVKSRTSAALLCLPSAWPTCMVRLQVWEVPVGDVVGGCLPRATPSHSMDSPCSQVMKT